VNIDENVRDKALSYTDEGNVNQYNHCGKQCGGSSKTKNRTVE
jgi:hypothetical protein